jgi:cold shock CspA family protein
MKGTVARWLFECGFGFIRPENADATHKTGDDIFCHFSALPDGLEWLAESRGVFSPAPRARASAVRPFPRVFESKSILRSTPRHDTFTVFASLK